MIYNEESKTKSKNPKNPFQVGFFSCYFFGFFWVGFFGANPGKNLKSLSKDVTILFFYILCFVRLTVFYCLLLVNLNHILIFSILELFVVAG